MVTVEVGNEAERPIMIPQNCLFSVYGARYHTVIYEREK